MFKVARSPHLQAAEKIALRALLLLSLRNVVFTDAVLRLIEESECLTDVLQRVVLFALLHLVIV